MQNRKRLTNLLIAGTLTVLLLTVYLAFRGGDTAVAASTTVEQTAVTATSAAFQSQIEALQAQNTELRSAVQTLQAREAEYQQQIESANQTINELSAQSSSLAAGEGGFGLFGAPPPHAHGSGGHDH